ncbi:protein sip-5 [Pseudoxanthomonas beigongshangi]|uniref:protein sip-5 n=1 Tax=Pseudoxanthomonas beigongshangi TaxID=2782537 RepID=UPI00193AF988|nr:protein sip-5 [Pseudoxanthomonas beigongshangi]
MNFERLQRRVDRAEQLVEGRALQTRTHWQTLSQVWRDSWTPGRIMIAGLVSGFLAGRAEPLRSMNGARWLQMVGSLSSLFATVQAATAADQASEAAGTAQAVQEEQAGSQAYPPEEPLVDEAFDEEEMPLRQPMPAEAATEISER